MKIAITISDCSPAIAKAVMLVLAASEGVEVVEDTQLAEQVPTLPTLNAPSTPTPSMFPPPSYADDMAKSVFGGKVAEVPNVASGTGTQTGAATVAPSNPPPPASTAGSVTPANAGELDDAGYPWDKRIHSSMKNKLVKDGTWKLIRGVDPTLVANVRAEYDAQRGAASAAKAVPVYNVPPVNPAPPATQYTPPVNQQAAYTPPAPAYTPPAPDPYQALTAKITGCIAAGTIQPQVFGGMFNHFGIKDLQDLANHPQKWPLIEAEIVRLTGGQ